MHVGPTSQEEASWSLPETLRLDELLRMGPRWEEELGLCIMTPAARGCELAWRVGMTQAQEPPKSRLERLAGSLPAAVRRTL